MHDSKMRKMLKALEDKCAEGNTKGWVYLPDVWKKRIEASAQMGLRIAIRLAITTAISYPIGKWMFYLAYLERGYEALGGEYLATCLLSGLIFYLVDHVLYWLLGW